MGDLRPEAAPLQKSVEKKTSTAAMDRLLPKSPQQWDAVPQALP